MKTLSLIIVILLSGNIHAQSIERQVLGSTGGTFSTGSITVTSTVGETSISTYTGSLILTQGYQQGDSTYSTSVQELAFKASYALYPNPTNGFSNLSIMTESLSTNILIEIYSTEGKLISKQKHALIADTKSILQLDLTSQAAGVYFIKIKDSQNYLSKTLRIIKQ